MCVECVYVVCVYVRVRARVLKIVIITTIKRVYCVVGTKTKKKACEQLHSPTFYDLLLAPAAKPNDSASNPLLASTPTFCLPYLPLLLQFTLPPSSFVLFLPFSFHLRLYFFFRFFKRNFFLLRFMCISSLSTTLSSYAVRIFLLYSHHTSLLSQFFSFFYFLCPPFN